MVYMVNYKYERKRKFTGKRKYIYWSEVDSMEQKKSRLFALLLMTVLMITGIFAAPAGAWALEENKKENIKADSVTTDSIILKVEDGYEYAIQIKEKKDTIWKWAKDKQYVRDETTKKITKVVFSGLDADTEYVFGKRLKNDEAEETEPVTQRFRTEAEEPITKTETVEPATKETEATTEAIEVTTEATEATTETTEVTTEETEPETKSAETIERETEPTNVKPSKTPSKPVPAVLETASETQKNKEPESKKSQTKEETKETESETGTTKTETEPETETIETEETESETKAPAAKAPAAPKLAGRTETSITLATIENGEYGMVLADAVINESEAVEAQSQDALANLQIAWQDSPEFTGLTSNTEYIFVARMKYDAATTMESLMSESVMYKTLLPFEGSTVTGVAVDGSYESGTKLTATAVGNGMDNVNPADGDSRWVPRTWNWGRDSFDQWKDGYTIPFTLVEVGNYRLSVDFEREEYTDGAWKATGVVNTVIVPFKVTAAPVTVYTITATAGANGTLSPQGNVTVANGNDVEFTFKPNNGYKVSKVYVDGAEVQISNNNKFAFKAVNANHTISVTFEQAKKIDSPKTGDGMNMTVGIAILVISAALLIGIVIYNQSKKKR